MAGRTAECQGQNAWTFCQRNQEANAMRIGPFDPLLDCNSMLTPNRSRCPNWVSRYTEGMCDHGTWSDCIGATAPWKVLIGLKADHGAMVSSSANQNVFTLASCDMTLGKDFSHPRCVCF